MPQRVVVIGGGLAGIAAAVRLGDAGVPVTVIEARKRLGGRATSFADPATGQLLDNCQHVLMRCCTNLVDLYHRLGVADKIEWHQSFHFRDRAGRLDTLEAGRLPAPLHLAPALWRFRALTLRDKWAITRGMWALLRTGARHRQAWHDCSFADWLTHHRQPAAAVEKFWAPVTVSALNEQPDRMAADYAMQVFRQGFLAHPRAFEMGLAAVPLVQLYDTAEQVITSTGGRLLMGLSARELIRSGRRITAVRLSNGETLPADAVLTALPCDRLARLCDDNLRRCDARLRHLDDFEFSPILGIHLWFEGTVMDLPHLALTQSPLQWLFNQGFDLERNGQHLHGVISGAHELMDRSAEELVELAVNETRCALPAALQVRPLHAQVIKERRATFAPRPGVDRLRPAPGAATPVAPAPDLGRGFLSDDASSTTGAQATPSDSAVANLYLAGDWCQTRWPATMESAVRSGYLAAADLLTDAGRPPPHPLAPDLRETPLYRLLSRRN